MDLYFTFMDFIIKSHSDFDKFSKEHNLNSSIRLKFKSLDINHDLSLLISIIPNESNITLDLNKRFIVKLSTFECNLHKVFLEIKSLILGENLNSDSILRNYYESTIIDQVITFSEASNHWNLSNSTLRQLIKYKKKTTKYSDLIYGIDYKKSGNTWLILKSSMYKKYGYYRCK